MKFWQKSFLGILAVFIVFMDLCLYLTSEYSFTLNLDRDKERALGEYNTITNGMYESINSIYIRDQKAPDSNELDSLARSYANYYIKQGVTFELKRSGRVLFSNIPESTLSALSDMPSEGDSYVERPVSGGGGINYICISGSLGGQFQSYTLVYLRDLSELYQTHAQLTRYLLAVSGAAEILLMLVLYFLLKRLTRPIGILQTATRRIAGGVYNERVDIRGRDEFHDLSENFNQMALSIEDKINELDKNAQNKQRLIDNLAHELRTPLTAIRGYAEYLQAANTSEGNRIEAAGYIISETDRMKNLAFKLLDLALVRNNKLEIAEISPLKLFLEQVMDFAQPGLKDKHIDLKLKCSLKKLNADQILLQSLLLNLIGNAAAASEYGSVIELDARLDDAVPILEVRDHGCGMDAGQVSLVCEPFYRTDKSRSRSSGGVGLGLSLCREIAQLHGAELKILSQPGKGTTIRILFTTLLQVPENSLISEDV